MTGQKKKQKKKPTAIGRPRKYETAKQLEAAINKYFRSISRTVAAREPLTNDIILNDDGEEMPVVEYIRPPSVSGMCLYLGIDRSTWQNYCDRELHPEFQAVTEKTRARMEWFLEEQLLLRHKGIQGVIFSLQNNYGWKQKQEVELGEATRKTAEDAGMSLFDKIALIAEAQKLIGEPPQYHGEDGEEG